MVRHHAPLVGGTSSPNQANNAWKSAFATGIFPRGDRTNVRAWIFSHTHYMTKGGVKVVSNQRGYVLPEAVTGHELQKKENRTGFDIREVV